MTDQQREPQWIDRRRVLNMTQHEYASVPESTAINRTGWQSGLPHTERRYIDGFKAGIAHIDAILSGWGWNSSAGIASAEENRDD